MTSVQRDMNVIVQNNELAVEFGPCTKPGIRGNNCLLIDWTQSYLDASAEKIRHDYPDARIDTWCMDLIRVPLVQWNETIKDITASVVVIRYFPWFANLNHDTPLFDKYVKEIYNLLLKAWQLLKIDGLVYVSPSLKYHKNIAISMGFEILDENKWGFVLQKKHNERLNSLLSVRVSCKTFRIENVTKQIEYLQQLRNKLLL